MTTDSPSNRTAPPRNKLAFGLGGFVFGGVLLVLLAAPVIGLAVACLQGDAQVGVAKFRAIFASERVLQLLFRTFRITMLTASISVALGWAVDGLLRRVGERLAQFWIILFAAGFLLSPYIYTQGWIGWVGAHGLLWRLLGYSVAPISIYSAGGLVAMLVISNLPLAVVFVYLSRRLFPAKIVEAASLFRMSFRQRLRLVEFPAVARGLGAGFLWIFVFSFWAYDVPSMLRQNMFSLEILAAFGSFYDYGRGLLLALPPVLVIVLLGLASIFFYGRPAVAANRFAPTNGSTLWPNLVLALIPIAVWGLPLIGLLAQINGVSGFWETIVAAKTDIANSARNGFASAGLAVVLCFLFAWSIRGMSSSSGFGRFFLLPLPWIALPAIVIGMGYVYLFNLPLAGVVTRVGLQLPFVELSVVVPVVAMLMLVQLSAWPDRWTAAAGLFRLRPSEQLLRIALPLFGPGMVAIFALGFAFAIREVPASLLNYPPAGGTIAISIETMLHFDRPEKVAALCIAQMLLLLLGCAPLLPAIRLIRYVRGKLQRTV